MLRAPWRRRNDRRSNRSRGPHLALRHIRWRWNNCWSRVQGWRSAAAGAGNFRRWRNDASSQSIRFAAACFVQFRRRRDYVHRHCRQRRRGESRTQAFRWRRSCARLEREQIGDCGIGMRQVYFGCVDNFLAWLVAARYTDGLRAVVSLLTSGTPRLAGLRSAAVLRLRQFVARVVDNVRLRTRWRRRNLQTYKALRNHNNGDQQKTLDQPANQHAAIWEH